MALIQRQISCRRPIRSQGTVISLCVALCLLQSSQAFLSLTPRTSSWQKWGLAAESRFYSTSSSQDSSISTFSIESQSSFWGCERTEDEIIDFVTNSLRSVDGTLTPRVEVASCEPPLVVIHNFISDYDCELIVNATKQQELKRSTMGATQEYSQERTSSTAWLAESQCEAPLRLLAEKTSRISTLPTSHMENLQVVKYLPGQEFQLHTDHLDSFNDLDCRGRLATCLMYLQSPEEGGETAFPEFDVELPPTKGSAAFFWNTLQRPGMEGYESTMFLRVDPKLRHAGLPVLQGEKWVCNRWIHPIDYGANVRGISS